MACFLHKGCNTALIDRRNQANDYSKFSKATIPGGWVSQILRKAEMSEIDPEE